MFDFIRKAFNRPRTPGSGSPTAHAPMSEWAATQGWGFSVDAGQGMTLKGDVEGRPWRLQVGPSTRDYIQGAEIRARAELGLPAEAAVLVMNRALKDALEKQAYEMYTDGLQTTVSSSMPEEMRWLSIYDEVGWDALPIAFWQRFCVLSDRREAAQRFLHPDLAAQLMNWPAPGPSPQDPMLVLLLNGKAYLRMAYRPASLDTVRHASQLFSAVCETALKAFPA